MIKRITALLLIFFYTSTTSAFAFSELYYLKNIKTDDVKPYVESSYAGQKYNVIKQDPYYGVSQSGDDYAVVILQQSGGNMFYYYNSEKNTRINKAFLKEIQKRNIVCEQSFNTNIISIYDNLAKDVLATSGATKVYSFEEPENSAFAPPAANQAQKQNVGTLKGYVGQIASGTKIPVYLQSAINTSTASKGDRVTAVLTDNLSYNGAIVAPQGSVVYGTLTTARNATYGSRNGRVVINFNQLVTPEGNVYNISAEEIDFSVSNEGKVSESVKNAVATAAVGALVGLLVSALSDNHHAGRSAAIGAGIGAGGSLIKSTAERGVDAEIPSFTELELTLTQPINVSVSY